MSDKRKKIYKTIDDFVEDMKMSLDEFFIFIEKNQSKLYEAGLSLYIEKKYGKARPDLDSRPLTPIEEIKFNKKLDKITKENKFLENEFKSFNNELSSKFTPLDNEIIELILSQIKKGGVTDYNPEYDEPRERWAEEEIVTNKENQSFLEVTSESIIDALKNEWKFRIGQYQEFVFYSEVEDCYYAPFKAELKKLYVLEKSVESFKKLIDFDRETKKNYLKVSTKELSLGGEVFNLKQSQLCVMLALHYLTTQTEKGEPLFGKSEIEKVMEKVQNKHLGGFKFKANKGLPQVFKDVEKKSGGYYNGFIGIGDEAKILIAKKNESPSGQQYKLSMLFDILP